MNVPLFFIFFLCLSIFMLFSIIANVVSRNYSDVLFIIKNIISDQNSVAFSYPWFNELLNDYDLEKIKIILIKESLLLPRIPLVASPAFALCVSFPVQKSIIVLREQLLNYPQPIIHFAMAHELGHIIDYKGIHKLFRTNNYIRQEIAADAFASSIVGKNAAIETLTELSREFTKDPSLNIRIMAIFMPTLFRQCT